MNDLLSNSTAGLINASTHKLKLILGAQCQLSSDVGPQASDLLIDLKRQNQLSELECQRAENLSRTESMSVTRAILTLGFVEEPRLLKAIASQRDVPFFEHLNAHQMDEASAETLTLDWCHTRKIVPIVLDDGSRLMVTTDPDNHPLIGELEFFLGLDFSLALAPSHVVREKLKFSTINSADQEPALSSDMKAKDQRNAEVAEQDGPVKRFVDEIFDTAVSKSASDIHFEVQEEGLRVRVRRNGTLENLPIDSSVVASSALARVKVLASMNVSQRRLPQDGRITRTIGGRTIDFRVSSVPTSYGESIVCRVLDPKALRLGWDRLGFDDETSQKLRQIVEQPSGLFLVTGPTGSGKTTTLYTALSHLNEVGRKILTVEDPIEYNLDGVEQVQVHEEIGMTFAVALRAFLRQDPNVIMVGEIRDQETAEIACRAALVGRMVLSTLHTNSAEGAVTRLLDLGVPRYVINDVLRGVLGQKLEKESSGQLRLKHELLDIVQSENTLRL